MPAIRNFYARLTSDGHNGSQDKHPLSSSIVSAIQNFYAWLTSSKHSGSEDDESIKASLSSALRTAIPFGDDERGLKVRMFLARLADSLSERCFGVTESGNYFVGPYGSKEGDWVAAFIGGQGFYILREDGDKFKLIGDAFVLDIIELFEDGEF